MRVLFISREKKGHKVSPIIINQGESLSKLDIEIEYYLIKGKCIIGYLIGIYALFRRKGHFDVYHAHYAYSGIAAALAFCRPLIVSLMGSESFAPPVTKTIVRYFAKHIWSKTIIKSPAMNDSLKLNNTEVIPNGVDLEKFYAIDCSKAQILLGWDMSKIHILFGSDPLRFEKNYPLADSAIKLINNNDIVVHFLKDIPNDKLYLYYSACNVLLLTSLWEGSSNVIKEGMACNCKIVSTDVGDVRYLFESTEGTYIAFFNEHDVAQKIQLAIATQINSNGREKIIQLAYDSESVSKRIKSIYSHTIMDT